MDSSDPLSLNLYTYCANNPVMYIDPSGHWFETFLDIAGIVWSIGDLIKEPSWANAGFLIWDIGAVLLPIMPGSYISKGGKLALKGLGKVDDVVDAGKNLSKVDDVIDAGKAASKVDDAVEVTVKLSNKNIQHIKKHTFEGMVEQAKYLTDEQLAAKLSNNTFFNKNWSSDEVIQYVQQGYNYLISQGKTGKNAVTINDEIIYIITKDDGTFDTAYGIYEYTVKDFR